MLTELRLDQLLRDTESFVMIEKVKELIFEAEREHFQDYLTTMLSALNSNVDDIEQAELQVIQDAWTVQSRSLRTVGPLPSASQ
jgi:hypothetical protein